VQNKEQQDQIKAMNLMLKEVLAQQTSIVSKLHVTETELLLLSKSKGKGFNLCRHQESGQTVRAKSRIETCAQCCQQHLSMKVT
jgi:hypothetical protein